MKLLTYLALLMATAVVTNAIAFPEPDALAAEPEYAHLVVSHLPRQYKSTHLPYFTRLFRIFPLR